MSVQIGDVLWLKMRFNNDPGTISSTKHPYVVVGRLELEYVEIAQLDSLKGKEYKVAFKSNHLVRCAGQTALSRDGYVQMDNSFMVDDYDGLSDFVSGKLTDDLTQDIVNHYYEYQHNNQISENKQVYITQDELKQMNSD